MTTHSYGVRFEADGADLFVELLSNDSLNRQQLLERVLAILEDRHGMEERDHANGVMTQVVHSDGSTLLAWLSIAGETNRQPLDDEGLDVVVMQPASEADHRGGTGRSVELTNPMLS